MLINVNSWEKQKKQNKSQNTTNDVHKMFENQNLYQTQLLLYFMRLKEYVYFPRDSWLPDLYTNQSYDSFKSLKYKGKQGTTSYQHKPLKCSKTLVKNSRC